jgi:hypothetical protein
MYFFLFEKTHSIHFIRSNYPSSPLLQDIAEPTQPIRLQEINKKFNSSVIYLMAKTCRKNIKLYRNKSMSKTSYTNTGEIVTVHEYRLFQHYLFCALGVGLAGKMTLAGMLRCECVLDNAVAPPRIKLSKLRRFELINLFSSSSMRLDKMSP